MHSTATVRRWLHAIARRIGVGVRRVLGARKADPERPVMTFTFAAMGRIAKSGGRVRDRHIREAELLIGRLGLRSRDRAKAIEWFDAGKTGSFDFGKGANLCRQVQTDRERLLRLCLEWMTLTAWIDGPPGEAERSALIALADLIGARGQLDEVEALVRARRLDELPKSLRDAHATLGTDPWVDDGALTLAYRRLLNRHHPDKFAHSSAVHAMDSARRRTIAIRDAYELILASRSSA